MARNSLARRLIWTLGLGLWPLAAAAQDDILIADFEGPDYGAWKTTGEAFGSAPARGTLPGQMPVTGFEGQGLVNSFLKGDDSTGTLTSGPIKIERKFLNFLIGGGKHPGKTCINLLHQGAVVLTASGPNDGPGGNEELAWHTWDVSPWLGKEVVIEIVDRQTGGWGHVNVDHILQSDRRRMAQPATRELTVERRYLLLPVRTGATKRRMSVRQGDEILREFEIELADDPQFWAFLDLSAWRGRKLALWVNALAPGSKALDMVRQDDAPVEAAAIYREPLRPQFHFTSRRGWLNDPNGLVYSRGEYHLFYQHNPYGWNWGNMHWAHAVSRDLVHWQEQPIALYPRAFGDWAFSGSAVVDRHNTSGLGRGDGELLVAFYTSTGRGECVVYSRDAGRTWTEYEGNPVVKHQGRDPKVIWHPQARHWVMAVYDEHEGKQWIAFYSSPDLKAWKFASRIEGFFECPDVFSLPVAGSSDQPWVLYAADGKYVLGKFDGRAFRPDSGKHQLRFGRFYAAQSFDSAPQGRRIQIGWANGVEFPGMPFNQQMTIPCELTLRPTDEGARMFAEPVPQLEALRRRTDSWQDFAPGEHRDALAGLPGELLDVRGEFKLGSAESLTLSVHGVAVRYDAKKQELTCQNVSAPLAPSEGSIRLRVLVDRGSVEVFANSGRVAMSVAARPALDKPAVELTGPGARVQTLAVSELRSAWEP